MGFLSAIGGIVGNIIAPGIGGAIGSGLGGLGDSLISGSASKSAASTQAAGDNAAVKLQADMYNQNRADHLPYLGAGTAANNELAYLMGITPVNPDAGATNADGTPKTSTFDPMAGVNTSIGASGSLAKPFSMSDFTADPGYQFRLDQGQKALERSAAAKGGLMSGAALKATTNFAQGTAAQEYQSAYDRYNTNQNNLYSRLAGISNSGQGAANTVGQAGQNAANNSATPLENAAQINATGQVAQSNAWSTGLGQIGSALSSSFSTPTGFNDAGTTFNGSPIIWN